MSDTLGTPSEDLAGTPSDAGAEEEWAVPPVWEKAMAVVPDSLRGDLIAQIRTSEREAQKAIEDARQGSVEPAWRDFVNSAKQASVNPDSLVESYNLQQQMLADPQAFLRQLSTEVDKMVASGQLTAAQGVEAKKNVAQQVEDEMSLESPEAKQIRELQERIDQLSNGFTAEQQARQDAQVAQQQEQQALAYYNDFTTQTLEGFKARGYDVTPGSPTAVSGDTVAAIMRLADSALAGDTSGTLTEVQAITGAFNSMDKFMQQQGGRGLNPVGTPRAQQPPVGNGRGAAPPTAAEKAGPPNSTAAERQRYAAMLAAGQNMVAQGISDEPVY